VWFYIWRVGCPPCRPGVRAVQHMYAKHADSGLAVLGFNQSDDKEIALSFMQKAGVTFPVILDSSEAAEEVAWEKYHTTGVPVNYIFDREGVVVDAWYGYEKGHDGDWCSRRRL
jgi:peroxiredoxin